jgi:hypothetical protein
MRGRTRIWSRFREVMHVSNYRTQIVNHQVVEEIHGRLNGRIAGARPLIGIVERKIHHDHSRKKK